MGHHDDTPTTWFGRVRIPNGDISIYSRSPAHPSAPATSFDNRIDPNVTSLYDFDDDADNSTADDLVPGVILMHSGTQQLEFIATRTDLNGSTTTLSTLPRDLNPVIGACDTYVHVPRDSINLSHLVLWRHQQKSMLYQEMDWLPLESEGPTLDMQKFHVPIVTCGTPSIAGHLAWCLDTAGGVCGGVRLGMCLPSIARNVAFFCRRTDGREEWVATRMFLVLMNKFDPLVWRRYGSSLNKPLHRLFWFASPDLTGKETADGAVLKLVELSVGASRPTPVTRRLEKDVVPAFPDLGQGAFTVANTGTTSGTSSAAEARTEYLYYVITTLPNIDWYTPYLDGAMDDASTRGDLAALNWWLDSGLVLDYTEDAVTNASISGHVHVLQWWYDHKDQLEFKYKDHAVNVSKHVDVLRWWRDTLGAQGIKYTEEAVQNASGFGKLDVLDWWLNESGLEFKYNASAVNWIGSSQHMGPDQKVKVLRWWKEAHVAGKLPRGMLYTEEAMDSANSTQVLDWWIEEAAEASLPLKFSPASLVTLDLHRLRWWKQRADEGKIEKLLIPNERNLEQVFRASKEAMAWWMNSGLLSDETMQRLVMVCFM
ncbi:hypothetical protein BCR44DRAFT_1054051 [Catenaria anguillulae PL171]|uniref:Uncharacterized protein n=1 Tax=Catenaria anguillulae PL171 TaxID=765915 RepID=A0A1Y2H532_9FUNG|nr:hypothetical protein BCR44DRAFT_1054051 [Catenaria anguillulae PL171]